MKLFQPIIIVVAVFTFSVLVVPTIIVSFGKERETTERESIVENIAGKEVSNSSSVNVAVFREKTSVTESIPLEEYVTGVVASETFPTFEMEA